MKNIVSGYRTIILAFFGFWFAAEIPHEVDGVFIKMIAGPFESKKICEKYRDELEEAMSETGGKIMPKCIERKEA